jgi:hypothetical protein
MGEQFNYKIIAAILNQISRTSDMARLSYMGLNQFGWFPEFLVSCTDETEFNKASFSPTCHRICFTVTTRTRNLISLFCSISKKECRLTTGPLKGKVVEVVLFFIWRTCTIFPTNTMGLSLISTVP